MTNNNKIIASLPLCNNASIGIIDFAYFDEKVIYKFSFEEKCRKAKLYENNSGEFYFKIQGRRYYLNEFLRIE